MGDDRLFSEIERLRRVLGPQLCSYPAPCETVTASEVALLPGGLEERTGLEPRPLCVSCPGSDSRHVRHVEVVRDYRGLHGAGEGASAARMADTAHDGAKQELRIPWTTEADVAPDPGGGLPAAWGPDHPARLALEGRETQERPRRRGDDGASRIDPRDFGLCVPHIVARFRLKPNKNV